jgi:flagellar protein FliO/FliZ
MKGARCGQFALAALGVISRLASAQQPAAAPSAVTGQALSLLVGMALVLGVIAAAAWLLKRIAPRAYGSSSMLRVIAGAAVGQRERVVIVEVGTTWLVVGVAPGCVNTLHQMPRPPEAASTAAASDAPSPFAQFLKKFTEKRGEH